MYEENQAYIPRYMDYQGKYRESPRENDKVILGLLKGLSGKLLDIGCSTGNLLYHIKKTYPQFQLTGGDYYQVQIDACIKDQQLAGIDFKVMDVLDLPKNAYDVIVANALLFGFDEAKFEIAIKNVSECLKPGGTFIALDFFHPFDQFLSIVEKSADYPKGHAMHLKPYGFTRGILERHGFRKTEFHPFEIPIELPFINYQTLTTYTRGRMQFRGTMFQPWCHLKATSGRAT